MDHKNSTGISENLRKLSIHSIVPNFNRQHSIINEIDEIEEAEEIEKSQDIQKKGPEMNRKKSIFHNNDVSRKVHSMKICF